MKYKKGSEVDKTARIRRRGRRWGHFALVMTLFAFPQIAEAKLNVVATLPNLASLARAIGGDRVNVAAIAKPNEDPHYVQAKPSYIVMLNNADVLIENGLDLEIGWLPALVDQTRNAEIRPGSPGRVVASTGIVLLEVPVEPVTRAMGDVHAGGNPHFTLDPDRARVVAQRIFDGLAAASPDDTEEFRRNLDALIRRIEDSENACKAKMAPYVGVSVVTYHRSLTYFCRRFGLNEVNTVEVKPGVPPSPSHITELIDSMKRQHAKLVLMEPWHERRIPDLIAEQAGAKVVEVPVEVGAEQDIPDYPALCGVIVDRIADALR